MTKEYHFYDYIDADKGSVNVINTWLNNEAKDSKFHFNQVIKHLEASTPPGTQGTFWIKKYAKRMKGDWKGFWEIRRQVKNVQYRLMGWMNGREVFLVAYATHKEDYLPIISSTTAKNRVRQIIDNPKKYRRNHDNR